MNNVKKVVNNWPLMWTEALRALLCMSPMLLAGALGKTSYLVALGQGGFFFSSLYLPKRVRARLLMGSILMALGLGFYLIGGSVAPIAWVAVLFTFFVSLNLSFLSNWKIGGPLALTFVMIYTAGLNTGSPQKAANTFLLFALVIAWSTLVSLLPIWKPISPPIPKHDLSDGALAEQGLRMGIGTAIALTASYMFGFNKLGWAPSAVGSVVRYDEKMSKVRAWARLIGTVIGAIIAIIILSLISSITAVVTIGAFFAVLNGLFKKTKLGMIPLFYTITILLLYSANDISSGKGIALDRFVYNLLGVVIGILVVIYPFPRIMKRLRANPVI